MSTLYRVWLEFSNVLQVCRRRLTTSSSPCLRVCFAVLYDKFCWTVCFPEMLCDDDISPFIDVLEDFHAVDVVELSVV